MKTADHYIIRVNGHMGKSCQAHFEGLKIQLNPDGSTTVAGNLDQAGLHGVLMQIRDLGLKVLQVNLSHCEENTSIKPNNKE